MNTTTFETKFSARMQINRFSVPVWAGQASFEERANLKTGQSVVRPYVSVSADDVVDYERGVDISFEDYTMANETLVVNSAKVAPFYIDDLDELQSNYSLMTKLAQEKSRALNKVVDGYYLAEVANADNTVDAGDIGGSSGSPISLTSSNVLQVYAKVLAKLQLNDVDIAGIGDPRPDMTKTKKGNMKPRGGAGFANINPMFNAYLNEAVAGRATERGDMVGRNGYVNTYFEFDNYVTTNGYWVGVLDMATNPTDGDTVTINGVEIEFKTALSGADNEVLIGGDADTTRGYLEDLLNNPSTSNAQHSALSASDQKKVKRMTATNDNAANTLTITAVGRGYVTVSDSLTAGGDGWSSQVSYQMFGQKGAVDMVVAKQINIKVSDAEKRLGNYIKPHVLYGLKTFSEGTKALVKVAIDSSNW